jgi:hypothetical protein
VVEPDSIRFNYKTQKALIWNSSSDQGEFRVLAEKTKKENDSVYFLQGADSQHLKTLTIRNIIFIPIKLN